MFYALLKIPARLALKFYCRDIRSAVMPLLHQRGPLLIAANHPNSFLDAVIIAAHCRRKTYTLVRGDVFKNKQADYFLRKLCCIPIYRRGEGRALMDRNELTFRKCLHLLRQGNNILIFSEGICENEWTLRPLGKGTARLAFLSWQQPGMREMLQVIPVGITYENFDRIGKKVFLVAGEPITASLFTGEHDGKTPNLFNRLLEERLRGIILSMPPDESHRRQLGLFMDQAHNQSHDARDQLKRLQDEMNGLPATENSTLPDIAAKKRLPFLLAPFALAGWLIHAPLYYPLRSLARKRAGGTVYYDSVLFGLLFFFYPLFLAIITAALALITQSPWSYLFPAAAPVLAFITLRSGLQQALNDDI